MERSLVERARAGDRDAFDGLVRTRIDAVYRTAYTILGNDADARDATQEVFIAVWRNLPSLRDAGRFDAWLGRIVTNACRMAGRRRRSIREIPVPDGFDIAAPTAHNELAASDGFEQAFWTMPVEQRALLVARHVDGRSVAQLAVELAVPEGTVKSRLFTARTALRRALEEAR